MTGRVSDDRLRTIADKYPLSEMRSLAAELLAARDRIARADPVLVAACMRLELGAEDDCLTVGMQRDNQCYPCRARATLTGDADA